MKASERNDRRVMGGVRAAALLMLSVGLVLATVPATAQQAVQASPPIAKGQKIVMATHNLGQARRLGDEVIYLHQGRMVERAPVEKFFAQPSTTEAAAFIKGELPWV